MMCYALDYDPFFSFSLLIHFHGSATSLTWFHLHNESCFRHFRCFITKTFLLFVSVPSGLHLEVNPLHLHSWRLLIVHFHNDTPTTSSVFLT